MTAKDWTLLAVSFGGDTGLSPVQLQKSLFLLGQELPGIVGKDFYHFKPYNYGPFSLEVYRDAEALATTGYVSITQRLGQNWNLYTITEQGRDLAKKISAFAPADGVSYLKAVVEWAKNLSFQALVRQIYKQYPAYKENSVFQS